MQGPEDQLQRIPRSAILVGYVLLSTAHGCATYEGLRQAMGLRTDSSVRTAVRLARRAELVRVVVAAQGGKGGVAVVYLTETGGRLFRRLFRTTTPKGPQNP